MKSNIAASVAAIMCAIVVLAAVAVPTINGLTYDTISNSGSVGLTMKQSEAGDGFPFSSMTAEVDESGQLTATLDGVAMDGVDASSDQFVFYSSSLIVAVLGGSLTCVVMPAEGSEIVKCSGVTVEHGGDPVALTVSIDGGDAIALDEPTGKIYAPAADGKLKSFVSAAGMQKITPGMPTLGRFANVTAGSDGAGVFDSVGYDLVQVGDGINSIFGRGSAAEVSMLMDEPASGSVDLMSDVDEMDEGTDSGGIMALADDPIVVGSLKYAINSDGTATVSGVSEGETLTGALVIPDTIESDGTHNVTSIGSNAFRGCTGLTSVELPAGLTSIGNTAFGECTGLTSVELPAGLTSLGTYAFQNCTGLTSVELPAGLTRAPNGSFYNCTGLTSVELPAGLTSIGITAFSGCTGLTSVELPAGLSTIEDSAFSGCTGLTSVEFPEKISKIYSTSFANCTSLTSVEFPAGLTSIEKGAFRGCTGLTSVELPAGLRTIGDSAFSGCTGLTSVEFPAGLTTIWNRAFRGCTGLTSVELPAGLTKAYSEIFAYCSNLTTIKIPESLTSLNNGMFGHCTSLTSVELPAGLTSIEGSAFEYCTSLTSVELPAGLTSIGGSAFEYCTSLTYVELPAGLTSIGNRAFANCTGLTSVELPAGLTSIGTFVFSNCTMLKSVAFATPLDVDSVFYRDYEIKEVLNLSGSDVSVTDVLKNAEIRTDIPATVALDVVTYSVKVEGAEFDIIAVIPIILCAGLVIMCLGAMVFRGRD